MNRIHVSSFVVVSVVASALVMAQPSSVPIRVKPYPPSKTVGHTDDYHGTKVADPYRWLEDLDSADTAAWVAAQNAVTFDYLAQIPARDRIEQRLTRLWNFERYGVPSKEGDQYFYTFNTGLQNQAVLYVTPRLDAQARILLDPNTLSPDGTVALGNTAVSHDGRRIAYELSSAGSDWAEIKVRDVESANDLPDRIRWVKFSGLSWSGDGQGFFYSRYDAPTGGKALQEANYFHKLYYHRVGTPQSEDVLVYHRPDRKEWGFSGEVTEDGRYLVISVWQGTDRRNRVYYQQLPQDGSPVTADGKTFELLDAFDAQYTFIDSDGPIFYFFTDKDAPRGRVVAVDTRAPAPETWKTLVPESGDTIESVNVVGHTFFVSYLHDAARRVGLFDMSGRQLRDLDLPGIGTTTGFTGKRRHLETFYSFESFNHPATVYRYDIASGKREVFRQPKVDFTPADYSVEQVFYTSKDGTRIPMFISRRKDVKPSAATPALLYGYGGFNVSETPAFKVSNLVWMEMGGIYAVPNIRGGGEYGKAWHEAGTKTKKQNAFDDFMAAAEWLIANGHTSTPKLAMAGGSNGGLLVGACLTQRPDLFGAALPAVGVMDMLRFHKFTIGWAWVSDYGSSDDAEGFKTLYAYSPLHNLRPAKYPATFITTADHDDRVVPSHSFKFAAALQQAQQGHAPVLIRIETKAGHGAGKPTSKQIEEAADRWAFLVQSLGM